MAMGAQENRQGNSKHQFPGCSKTLPGHSHLLSNPGANGLGCCLAPALSGPGRGETLCLWKIRHSSESCSTRCVFCPSWLAQEFRTCCAAGAVTKTDGWSSGLAASKNAGSEARRAGGGHAIDAGSDGQPEDAAGGSERQQGADADGGSTGSTQEVLYFHTEHSLAQQDNTAGNEQSYSGGLAHGPLDGEKKKWVEIRELVLP